MLSTPFHRLLASLALGTALATATPALAQTAAPRPAAAAHHEVAQPVTILISIDGFRADYLSRGVSPNLSALAAGGISAGMHPSFPSKTFPNHYTLATGLRPDRNGIVANKMLDPRRPGEVFTMASDDPFWWSEAQPIWVAAERAGIRTATMFWPGSNVNWDGTRPQDWAQFNIAITSHQRVATVVDWLRRPAATRPRLVTLYFDTVDTAGHKFGPDSPEVTEAVAGVDVAIGELRHELAALGRPVNFVIVADHGMAGVSADRVVRLDQFANPADYDIVEDGPFASLNARPGHEVSLVAALAHAPAHVHCWPRDEIPARFHYGHNPRVPQYLCLADVGWEVVSGAPKYPVKGGTHGYDNDTPEMRALFIANGPSIKPLGHLPDFDNVDIEPLVRDLVGLPQGTPRDGNDAPFRAALKR